MTISRTLLPAATVAALSTVALTALTALPAQAEQATHLDPARDVRTFMDETTTSPRPNVANGDVRRFTAAHTQRQVTVRVGFRALTKTADQNGHYIVIKTPTGRAQVIVSAGPGAWDGQLMFQGSDDQDCAGAEHTINYRKDTFAFSVPRSCLGRPSWVRVGFGATTDANGERRADDARRDNQLRSEIALGPRLERG